MSDPGLSHRLRQRSRRAGLMIGLSMLLTIALCAVAFSMIYAALDGFTNDFISETDETATIEAQVVEAPDAQQPETGDTGGEQPAGQQEQQPTAPAEPEPTPTAAEEAGNADDGEFTPDYQLRGVTVNLRAGPSTANDIVTALPPSTPLEYLGEDAPTDSPADGERWMRFATEDGLEGWVREIDVTEYQP